MPTVLSFYTENLADVGSMNAPRWEGYCRRHDYTWRCLTPVLASLKFHAYWQKIHYILDELNNSTNNVLWTDIDVVVKDNSYALENILVLSDRDISVSSDSWGLCAGFMLIRNTPWARNFFKQLINFGGVNVEVEKTLCSINKGDQSAMKYFYNGFQSVSSRFLLLGEDIVSYPNTPSPSAPFHHYWLCGGEPNRKQLIDGLLNSV